MSAARIEQRLAGSGEKRGVEKKKARVTIYFKLALFYGLSFITQTGLLLGFSIPGVTIVELRVVLLLFVEKIGLCATLFALYLGSTREKGTTTTTTAGTKDSSTR